MAECPFRKETEYSITVTSMPSFESNGGHIGDIDPETGGSLDLPQLTFSPVGSIDATITPTLSYDECVEVQCAMWVAGSGDSLGYCSIAGIGSLLSNILLPSPANSTDPKTVGDLPNMVDELITNVIGTQTDIESLDIDDTTSKLVNLLELPDLFRKVIGSNDDVSNLTYDDGGSNRKIVNLLEVFNTLYNILGSKEDKAEVGDKSIVQLLSGDNTLLEYLKMILGDEPDKDEEGNPMIKITQKMIDFLKYLEDMVGIEGDKNDRSEKVIHLTYLLDFFREVIGTAEERDEDAPLITYLQNVLGKKQDLDEEITIAKLKDHIHKQHYHYMPHHYTLYTAELFGEVGGRGTIPKAAVLANEFMTSEDLDGNGSIYGTHFMIGDSPSKPKMLYGLETHPMWEDPPSVVSWEAYLSYFE